MKAINDAARYPEGPLWRDGKLFYVEFAADRISCWDRTANAMFWHEPGSGPCALGVIGDDFLLCAYDANAMIRIAPDGTVRARNVRDIEGNPFVGPNDLASDGAGGFFFTASGVFDVAAPVAGAVLHVDAQFRIRRLAGNLHYANGIAFDAARRRLYVSETLAQRVVRYEVGADLALGPPAIFCRLPSIAPLPWPNDPYAGGDGMKFDPAGRLLVACFGAGCLLAIAPDGGSARAIGIPLRYPTNLALDPATGAAAVTAVADPWKAPFGGAVFHLASDLLA
jgi:sugar lactone lactonase YvrE